MKNTETACKIFTEKMTALDALYTSLKREAEETGNPALRYAANHVNEQFGELRVLVEDLGLRWNGHKVFDPKGEETQLIADYVNGLCARLGENDPPRYKAEILGMIDGACNLASALGYTCNFDPLEGTFTVAEEE